MPVRRWHHLDKDGSLVTLRTAARWSRKLRYPKSAALQISIGQDGTVSYTLPGQSAAQRAGQIQLATLAEAGARMNDLGGNLYMPTDSSGDATR